MTGGRTSTFTLASERHGLDAEDFAHVDDLPTAEMHPMESAHVASLGRNVLVQAIDRATRAFLDELGRHDRSLADRLETPFASLLEASQAPDGQSGP